MASGLLFLVVAFAFTSARVWITDQTTINRAVMHIAPLALVWTIVVVHAWLQRRIRNGARGEVDPAATASIA
jgi:membrane protein YdbS with pleckstrin-like domain